MHRLPLILCAIALTGSTASALLYLRIGNSKQMLEQRLADTSTRAQKLDEALAAANQHKGSLEARLSAADAELGTTKARLTALEARAVQLDGDLVTSKADLDAAKSVLGLYETTARALADEVAALRQDLSDARSSNASPDAVAGYKNTIAELERQLAVAARNGAVAPAAAGASTAVFASRAGRATVLNVGPESSFVVLNFGSARGAEIGQKLSVSQGNDIVATVLISDVRANFSIAQVLPDTLRGVLHKGDSALLVR